MPKKSHESTRRPLNLHPPSYSSSSSSSSPSLSSAAAAAAANGGKVDDEIVGHVSGVAVPPSDEERVKALEFKLAIVEKQLLRLEDMISRGVPKRGKTMVINYDLGRDKNIDTS